jgi:hypothetical protein
VEDLQEKAEQFIERTGAFLQAGGFGQSLGKD